MDFKLEYTPEQEEFRREVRTWLEENIPPEMIESPGAMDNRNITPKELAWAREFWLKLGEKGWLDALVPPEYNNGHEFTVEEAIIIDEERRDFNIPSPMDLGVALGVPALLVYGSEEQKLRFLPDMLAGKAITWQLFTEPGAGTDLASVTSTAVWNEEEQVWIVNGSKQFGGGPFFTADMLGPDSPYEPMMPDYGYGPFVTEPDAPRHQNLTGFMIPMNLPGITPNALHMLAGGWRDITFFQDVRVPDIYRVGERGQGWRVINATLEREHGGGGSAAVRMPLRDDLMDIFREEGTVRDDAEAADMLMDWEIIEQIKRLFNTRNYWMRSEHIRWAWEGSQNAEFAKSERYGQQDRLLDIVGPRALLDVWDPLTILNGRLEAAQRNAQGTHAGGTIEAQKIVMGRRIGIGRHVRSQAHAVA